MTATGQREEDAKFFEEFGYIGPFDVLTPDEVQKIGANLRRQVRLSPNGIYPENSANHDRHLDLPLASWLISHPTILGRIESALGTDVLCWRSSFFPKMPGEAGTEWHQANRFYEFEGKPHLFPTKNENGVYDATAWLALNRVTKKNACLRVIPGSHKKQYFDESRPVQFEGRDASMEVKGERLGFYGYSYEGMKLDPNWAPDPRQECALELEPGQCVIFTSRLLHGSYPNRSEDVRLGFAARYCCEYVKVYPDAETFTMFGDTMPLDNYSTVLTVGEARHDHNVVSKPLPLPAAEQKLVGMGAAAR